MLCKLLLLFCLALPLVAQEPAPSPQPAHAAPEKTVRPRRAAPVPETTPTPQSEPTPDATPTPEPTPNATPEEPSNGATESITRPVSRCEGFPLGPDAQSILQNAKSLFIRSSALTVRAHEIENALLKRKDFTPLKIAITRDAANADLILELGHKHLSTRFYFTIVEPCTQSVVMSGRVSSLFGTVDGKVADSVVKQIKRARQP